MLRSLRTYSCPVLAFVVAGAMTLTAQARVNPGYTSTYGAKVVKYSLKSKMLRGRLTEVGIVPPGAARRPLLVLLHGRHDQRGDFTLMPEKSGPETMLGNALFAAIAQLGDRAPVVVLLNGGRHSWYHDRREGRWSSMILDEAIPDAVHRFNVRSDRIGIGGISMGGYGALHLAALRPHEFCAVGAHSAALYQSFRSAAPAAFDDAADFARNDVFKAARHGRFNRLPVWIDGGNDDPFHAADAAFASLLRDRGVDVTYRSWPGAHTASYWRDHMAEYLRFYASALGHCAHDSR